MRREYVSILVLVLLLGLFGGYAWLTHNPDSPLLEQAEEWPVVGRLAARFREAYLPGVESGRASPGEPGGQEGGGGDGGRVVPEDAIARVEEAAPEVLGIWVREGTPIHTAPSADSAVVATTGELANLPYEERRGNWYRIRLGDTEGWAHLAGKRLAWMVRDRGGQGAAIEVRPAPVVPVPSRPPDRVWLASGLALLGEDAYETRVGPYRLHTDVPWPKFIRRLGVVVSQLEGLYRERYALEPIPGTPEVILLFSRKEDYEAFSNQAEWLRGVDAAAHVGRGIVALYVEGRSRGAVVSSLLHELIHVLNQRSLGPALPPWLGEGLADDLSMSRVEPDGRIRPESLGGEEERSGNQILRRGGRASALLLQEKDDLGELPSLEELVRMDWPTFVGVEEAPLHYAQSAFLIRFLLSDWLAGTRVGFLGFLADTARGAPITEARLLGDLGRTWPELSEGFHVWLRLQFLRPTDEVRTPAGE